MITDADIFSRLDIDPNEKLILEIREGVHTQPIEANIQSAGTTQEDQIFFPADDVGLLSEEQPWQPKKEKRNAVHTKPPLRTAWHCYIIDNSTNTLMQSMEPFKNPKNINLTKCRPSAT